MANFFDNKVRNLCNKTQYSLPIICPDTQTQEPIITIEEKDVIEATRKLKSKKSTGIDNVPMVLVKDTSKYMMRTYVALFQLATSRMPKSGNAP